MEVSVPRAMVSKQLLACSPDLSRRLGRNRSSGTIFWGWFSPGDLCGRGKIQSWSLPYPSYQPPMTFPMLPGHGGSHTYRQIQQQAWIYHLIWQKQNIFLHCIYYNRILTQRKWTYFCIESQNDFWHVPQTCPDPTSTTVRPARFFGVEFPLGTCAHASEAANRLKIIV